MRDWLLIQGGLASALDRGTGTWTHVLAGSAVGSGQALFD